MKALIDRLTTELPNVDLERVTQVTIRADPMFSPPALEQAFEMLTPGTPLEGSRLVVEDREDERECPECGTTWTVSPEDVAGHLVLCPSCGTPSLIEGTGGIELVSVMSQEPERPVTT